ncbi:MAG: FG-GAP repeat domain-containing protein, partial [Candidatus Hodarchaeales archaeon]
LYSVRNITDIIAVNSDVNNTPDLMDYFIIGQNGTAVLYTEDSDMFELTNASIVGTTNGGTIAATDITGDGIDDLFVAANGKLFAYDNTGTPLWNVTGLPLDYQLRELTVVEDSMTGEYQIILASLPTTIDFDTNTTNGQIINSTYLDQGIQFSDSWGIMNSTLINPSLKPYYPTSSGDMFAFIGGDDNGYIDFKVPQQFISFDLNIQRDNTPYTFNLQVRALDSSNNTVFLSEVIGNVSLYEIRIALPSAMISRIEFTGLTGFSNYLVIDDLIVGGTTILSYEALTGTQNWQYELIPTKQVIIHDSTNIRKLSVFSRGGITTDLLTIGYTIHPDWELFRWGHKGSLALNQETGLPYWTFNPGANIHEAVGLDNSFFSFLYHYSELETQIIIDKLYYETLYYEAQNEALWQANTNRPLKTLVQGNLDSDTEQEIVAYRSNLVTVVDHDGQFLWKYLDPLPIRTIVLADYLDKGVDQVVLLTNDGGITILNPTNGLPYQDFDHRYINNYETNVALVIDVNNDGKLDLVIGSGRPGGLNKGRVNAWEFVDSEPKPLWSKKVPGIVTNLKPAVLNADLIENDLIALGREEAIYAIDGSNGDVINSYSGDPPVYMTTGDINDDDFTDVGFIDINKSFTMLKGPNLDYIWKYVPVTEPFDSITSLTMLDFNGDGGDDVAIWIRGSRLEIREGTSANRIGVWYDPAIYGSVITTADIDRDGYEDYVVRNDNLIYALQGGVGSLIPIWSSPLSASSIVTAIPAHINLDGQHDIVFLNRDGQIFAVEGITSPNTLARPLILSIDQGVDDYSWTITTLIGEDKPYALPEISQETDTSLISGLFFLIGGLFGIFSTLVITQTQFGRSGKQKKDLNKLNENIAVVHGGEDL